LRKLKFVLTYFPILFLLFGFLEVSQVDPNADIAPAMGSREADTIRPGGFPYITIWNFNYANVPNMNTGTVGAMYLKGKYYFNRWQAPDVTYILDSTGVNGGPSLSSMRTVSYTGRIRDLTTDGRYLYGGKATDVPNILYKMDTNMTLITQFTLTGVIRAVAWDPNRKAFWYSDYSGSIYCRDTNNVLKGTITNSLTGKYGLGFDSTSSPDSAFIYVWCQGASNTTNNLVRYYFSGSGPVQLNNWVFTLTGFQVGLAGGAEAIKYPNPPRMMLLLNYQNFALVGYSIRNIINLLEIQNGVVRDYTLSQNSPNPFNPTTTITYTLSKANHVILAVYDAAGNLVKNLVDNFQWAGEHKLSFDASNLSSGVYFYRISVGDYASTKKMLLVK
jgi:hypothetical protein